MSQDNENKPDDHVFDPAPDNSGNDAGTPFADESFNPFDESGFSFVSEDPASIIEESEPNLSDDGLEELPAPSSFLTGDATEDSVADEIASEEVEEVDVKGKKKKKKEKAKKEKKPKVEKKKKEKKSKEPGEKTPMGLDAILSLVFGFLLLVGLIACNVSVFLSDPKTLGVGASSILYYVVIMDIIALIGIVSVPFLFFLYRKDIDVFKVGLGVSTMAMSLGVILLLTAFFRYDFTVKAPKSMPSTDIPVTAPPVAPQEE